MAGTRYRGAPYPLGTTGLVPSTIRYQLVPGASILHRWHGVAPPSWSCMPAASLLTREHCRWMRDDCQRPTAALRRQLPTQCWLRLYADTALVWGRSRLLLGCCPHGNLRSLNRGVDVACTVVADISGRQLLTRSGELEWIKRQSSQVARVILTLGGGTAW